MKLAAVLVGLSVAHAKLADRSRLVKHRQLSGKTDRYHDNGRPIEGQSYRSSRGGEDSSVPQRFIKSESNSNVETKKATTKRAPWALDLPENDVQPLNGETPEDFERKLSSQLSGCCYDYQSYYAADLCGLYGNDCEGGGGEQSHDSGDGDCEQEGLSFIGISFSVNTASGNPYSYQLCDQFPMENIIDRDYEYVMSMDEDGWLVGGGYKSFDYSGKMP